MCVTQWKETIVGKPLLMSLQLNKAIRETLRMDQIGNLQLKSMGVLLAIIIGYLNMMFASKKITNTFLFFHC